MDIALYYLEQGHGFPLILLHGNGEDHTYFEGQIEYFSRFYRVIAVDTRGHGQSPRGTAPFTISQFADDLLGFLDQLKIEKANILGFSDGGNIALTFALRHPERVEKLILTGANLNPKGVKRSVQFPVEVGYRIASLFKAEGARKQKELLGLMVKEPNFVPKDLADLRIPTLVIAGDRDMIKDSHTRQIAASLPNSELAILPGDHFIANKNPCMFNHAVYGFLKNSNI